MQAVKRLTFLLFAMSPVACDGGGEAPDDTGSPVATDTGPGPVTETGTPGAPCGEGAIAGACACGGVTHTEGHCCSDRWFDELYGSLTGGCPSPDAYRYVDPLHASASDDNAGTASMPWASLEHGVSTVEAGQVLVVRAGTYAVEGTGSRNTPALGPAHSGAAGSPVVIKAEGEVIVTSASVARGTARGGSPERIVLAEGEPSTDQAYFDHFVRIVGGTGAGQSRQIMRDFDDLATPSYDGATRTAWVSLDSAGRGNWDIAPDETSEYELVRTGPLLGTNGRQHVVWDGFHVVERDSYHPDTGPVVIWASDDVVLLDCDVEAMTTHLYDNHNAVRVEASRRAIVRNNRLHGVLPIDIGRNNPQNHSAAMVYTSEDLRFEHNEVFDSYGGFFPKGGDRGHVFRYNHVHDVGKAFRISFHDDVRIHGNLLVDCDLAFQGAENNGAVRIFNNTVVSCDAGLSNWFAIDGVALFGNVFASVAYPVDLEGEAGSFTAHHNVFFDLSDFRVGNAGVGGLGAWQALGYGEGSIVADPGFVDAASGDYRLAAGSPARGVVADLEDIDGDGDTTEMIPAGAWVTGAEVVGRRR